MVLSVDPLVCRLLSSCPELELPQIVSSIGPVTSLNVKTSILDVMHTTLFALCIHGCSSFVACATLISI